ncbi:MAG: agmatinase [Saprospiraceae bacterium]|jgi:agmatinase|nr:agmatinase [Candidatus Vicinibacter proximus]MBL7822496.1 agmatinase [Saprospiraceae bacterium]MCC6844303.1 agmatinase [Saprospiraceae bacterium]HRG34315.1 agmatinase [Saprospiraceae bacterium]
MNKSYKLATKTYAGIPDKFAKADKAEVILTSIPYDGTSTWGKGADKGFKAFLFASENMELFDIETNSEPYKHGVFLEKPLEVKNDSPEQMVKKVYKKTKELLKKEKFLTFFGGEHSVSIGVLRAYAEKYENLTVLQLDAHTDLRQEYHGSKYNHACAVAEAQRDTNLIQVGIRSMDIEEKKYLEPSKVYFAHNIMDNDYWMEESIKKMTDKVYITLDLDVFDSSLMPSTGTPEPGGMEWYQVLQYLRMVFQRKEVVGFDIVELAPNPHNPAPDFLTAKLYYKMLAYLFDKKRS